MLLWLRWMGLGGQRSPSGEAGDGYQTGECCNALLHGNAPLYSCRCSNACSRRRGRKCLRSSCRAAPLRGATTVHPTCVGRKPPKRAGLTMDVRRVQWSIARTQPTLPDQAIITAASFAQLAWRLCLRAAALGGTLKRAERLERSKEVEYGVSHFGSARRAYVDRTA
jgi:hypothetical protein